MKSSSFKIEGMSCSACANRVERVVKKMNGVEEASVNFATETLLVKFDDAKIDAPKIEEAIVKAGYSVRKDMRDYTFKVEGMSCSACANRVERITKKIDGVESANVNFATEKLTVRVDAEKVRYSDIKLAVDKAGFKLIKEEDQIKEVSKKKDESKILLNRFIFSLIFTVPLLIISMGHMVGMPLPSIIDPMKNPLNFALVQLVLTIPVMVAGYKFYKIGYKNLFKLSPNMDSLIAIGTSAAVAYGLFAIYKILNGETHYAMHLYFESAVVILTLITLGKYLEAVSKGKTSEAIKKLMGLAPKTATIIKNGKVVAISEGLVDILAYNGKVNAKLSLNIQNTSDDYSKLIQEKVEFNGSIPDGFSANFLKFYNGTYLNFSNTGNAVDTSIYPINGPTVVKLNMCWSSNNSDPSHGAKNIFSVIGYDENDVELEKVQKTGLINTDFEDVTFEFSNPNIRKYKIIYEFKNQDSTLGIYGKNYLLRYVTIYQK